MCGIAGYYSFTQPVSQNELEAMTNALSHRGPDSLGFYVKTPIAMGHRRLKVIDLTDNAKQPMTSHCGRYIIVYNGEVYNFKEISKELKITLHSSSDTEVILEAFVKWGVQCVHKFIGMFAIAIFDNLEKKLFLFRDRIGIKPLFYYYSNHCFAFASEIKALLKLNTISKNLSINKIAINEYLHLGYIPEPNTIYNTIHKFPSGSYGIITEKGLTIETYWNPIQYISPKTITNKHETKEHLKKLLVKSIQYRMISDVPFGTFLSGGIDSSLVSAIAQSLSPNPIKTFSIGFSDMSYNEAPYAKEVANYLKTEHYEITVTQAHAIELIDEIISLFDEPFADSSAIPTMLVSKLARQHVTMTLSGEGGDELFHGYGAYTWAKRLSVPTIQIFRKPIALILNQLNERCRRAAKVFNYNSLKTLRSHIFSQEQYLFTRNELKLLLTPDYFHEFTLNEEYISLPRNLSHAESQALFDLQYYLKDDLLVKVDRASMKYSLEARVPLLDHNIVEYALNIDESLKFKNHQTKFLLKEILYDYCPQNLFTRKKQGFSIPLKNWLQNELSYLITDYLSPQAVKQQAIFNHKYIEYLKNKFQTKHSNYLYNRLWAAIVLQMFLKK